MTIQVLTLNTWGLWLVSKKRYNRMCHIAEYLANEVKNQQHKLDIVLLQEVWCDSDVQLLMSAAREGGLKYALHFRSGIFGSGLLTLSRFPIAETAFHQYTSAGDPGAITNGDYYAAKGVGWVRVVTPSGPLDVFNTHLHANYHHRFEKAGEGALAAAAAAGKQEAAAAAGVDASQLPDVPQDEFAAFRIAQVLELARFVRHASGSQPASGCGVVLGGDLNCRPGTLEQALLRALLPHLGDAWEAMHTAVEEGFTCKAPGNTFPPKRQVPERIDYLLTTLNARRCQLALQHTPQGHSYSDHIAVQAELALPAAPAKAASAVPPPPLPAAPETRKQLNALLTESHTVLAKGVEYCAGQSMTRQSTALLVLMQALCMVLLRPIGGWLRWSMNPTLLALAPVLALAMAFVAAVLFVMGLAADSAQARTLQQALEQVEVAQVALALELDWPGSVAVAAAAAQQQGAGGGAGK